jgi:hypothetical protein
MTNRLVGDMMQFICHVFHAWLFTLHRSANLKKWWRYLHGLPKQKRGKKQDDQTD